MLYQLISLMYSISTPMSISPIRLHTALGRQRIISCLPPTTVSLNISSFHPNSQMYHIWAVNGELQCYQWCLFLLIGCIKRVSTAWSVRAPFNVVPSACSPTQMATSFHYPSLPWTMPPPPKTRIHSRKVWQRFLYPLRVCKQLIFLPLVKFILHE